MNKTMPKVALGAWSWGSGAAGGDQVFGNHLSIKIIPQGNVVKLR